MAAEFVRVSPVSIKERLVEAALHHAACCRKYGDDSDEAEEAMEILLHYEQHLLWLMHPETEDGSGPDLDASIKRLKLIKLHQEALLLKRGF